MRCCSSSSAEPPGGYITSAAATRFATRRMPSTIRQMVAGGACRLKFLGIVHTHAVAIQRLVVGGRSRIVDGRGTEARRRLQVAKKFDHRAGALRADHHIEQHLIARVDLRET